MDQQSVVAEHHGRFDPFALSHGSDEITDARQVLAPSEKVVAKLGAGRIEVNSNQSLEQPLTAPYPSFRMMSFSLHSSRVRASRCAALGVFAVAVGGLGSVAACKGLTSIDASFENVTDTIEFYPLNGSPPGAPTAIKLFSGVRERADESFAYDVAFDVTPTGEVKIIPARALASGFAAPYAVGLQRIPNATFDAVASAPKDGYTIDSTMTVGPGTVVVIQSFDVNTCAVSIKGQSYFSKLVVTSVDPATKKIRTVIEVNRNCGFHSFAEGKPKD
jgi:hypothetical protein